MKDDLLQYLACPACQEALSPSDHRLTCVRCGATYPVREGIPRFPLAGEPRRVTERTRRIYTFTWRRVGQREVEQSWEKDSYHYDALLPDGLRGGKGTVGLDAGCGGGADLLQTAQRGATLIGVDLSDGVETAARVTHHLANVHVVQADIHSLPFRAGSFDFIYSFGVLHHLPDPARGFERLAKLLKPGAPLVTYLYEDFSDRSAAERAVLALLRGVRTVTSRLPSSLLLAFCWMGVPCIWLCCSVPARLLQRPFPRLAGRIPFRHTLRWPVIASDLFDRFAVPIEWRYNRQTIIELYHRAGLERIETRQYRGWVSWGRRTAAAPLRPGA